MIIQSSLCGETNKFGTNSELTDQMRTRCRQVARELRCLGDSLENQYFRPALQGAGQNHERIQIGGNLVDIARFIFIRCVTELFGLNN